MSYAILESNMAASGLRKTGKYRQIPYNMGILRMGVTSEDQKSMSDAILESKSVDLVSVCMENPHKHRSVF